jgi:hypothetical protein
MTTTVTRLALLASTFAASTAAAQPTAETGIDRPMPAATDMLEIAVGGGYLQGFGDTGAGVDVQDLAGAGGNAELQIMYRVSPHLSIGGYGTLEGYEAGDKLSERMNDVVGASVGLKSDLHLRPTRNIDPWISAGGGMRYLWIDQNNTRTTTLRGLDLARVQLGIDYRINPRFAISPYVGATATMYLDKNDSMTSGYQDLDDKQISWSFNSGLLGRFDLGY